MPALRVIRSRRGKTRFRSAALLKFVQEVTTAGSPGFVPAAERIAVFDNDGTLWPENPMPFQMAFALDALSKKVATVPELAEEPMVQAALEGNIGKLMEGPHYNGLMQILALTHSGMTVDEFQTSVAAWIGSAEHPRFQRRYDQLAYLPMLELLDYLRAHDFKTFIVSGGGVDFMRVWTERVYGVPPEQVVGSTTQTRFELRDGSPVLVKTMEHLFVDDKAGKPAGIHSFVGRRPIACFGNSDGDQAMLEYTTINNPRRSLGMIVHHTDAEREYAYDAHPTSTGRLVTALAAALERGWIVVDMARDWKRVFANEIPAGDDLVPLLIDRTWVINEMDGGGLVASEPPTLEIAEDLRVSGFAGVNRYFGTVTLDGANIKFGPLGATRMAGPQPLMTQETRFFQAIERIVRCELKKPDVLYFFDADGKIVLQCSN